MRGTFPFDDPRRYRRADGSCRQSGKFGYRTRKKALKAPKPDGTRADVYKCRFCRQWHCAMPL